MFIAEARVASLKDLRYYFGASGKPVSSKEIIKLMESLSAEERSALRRNPDIPRLDYWDLLDAEERIYKDESDE